MSFVCAPPHRRTAAGPTRIFIAVANVLVQAARFAPDRPQGVALM